MAAAAGPVRYLFLRRDGPEREGDLKGWPPQIPPVGAEDLVCLAVQLTTAADGWRAQPLQQIPGVDEIPEDTLVLTRATELVLTLGRSADSVLALLGARVEEVAPREPGRLTHFVLLPETGGTGRRAPRPLLAPASALVVTNYAERGGHSEAGLGLRLTPGEVAELTPWLPDETIEPLAASAVDRAVLSPRARHTIIVEVRAGRVSLHGRAELASTAEAAARELETTPGVVDVADHLLVDESLQDVVEAALAEKGITGVRALAEHGLISLHGETKDAATRRQAEDIAAGVTGVRGVINRLDVRASS